MEYGYLDVLRGIPAGPATWKYAADEDQPTVFPTSGHVYVECGNYLYACYEEVSFSFRYSASRIELMLGQRRWLCGVSILYWPYRSAILPSSDIK